MENCSPVVDSNASKVFIVTDAGPQPVLVPDDSKKNFTVPEGYIVTYNRTTGTTTLVHHASVNNINKPAHTQQQQQQQALSTATSTIDPINIIQNQRSQQKQMLKALQHQNQSVLIHHIQQNPSSDQSNTVNRNPTGFHLVRMVHPPPPPPPLPSQPPPPLPQQIVAVQEVAVQNQLAPVQQVIYRNQQAANQIPPQQQVTITNQQTGIQQIVYRNQISQGAMQGAVRSQGVQQLNKTPTAGRSLQHQSAASANCNDSNTSKQMVLTQETATQQIRNLLSQTASAGTPVPSQSPVRNLVQGNSRQSGPLQNTPHRPLGQQQTSGRGNLCTPQGNLRTPTPSPLNRNQGPQFRSQGQQMCYSRTPAKNQNARNATPRLAPPNPTLIQLKFDHDVPQLVTPTAAKMETVGNQPRVIRIIHADVESSKRTGDESPNSTKNESESRNTVAANSSIAQFNAVTRPRFQRPKITLSPRPGVRAPNNTIACATPRQPEGTAKAPVVVMVAPNTENQDSMTVQQLLHGFGVDATGAHVDMQSFLRETEDIGEGANSIVINAQEGGRQTVQRRHIVVPVTNAPPLQSMVPFKPDQVPEEPAEKLQPGYFAVCPSCGYTNTTRKCARCKRKIPSNTKIQPFSKTDVALLNKTNDGITVVIKNDAKIESEDDKKKDKNGKRKMRSEPVEILILSDDEEDGESDSKSNATQTPDSGKLSKEPVYTIEDVRKSKKQEPLPVPPNEPTGSYSMLVMNHARIGNFKSELRSRLTFSNDGIQFDALSAADGEVLPVFIPKSCLKGVLVNYGAAKPVIFVYPSCATAHRIRTKLSINNDALFNYDPFSSVQAFRRMILTVERVTEENKNVLSTVLNGLLTEISDTERDDILALTEIAPPAIPTNRTLLNFEKFVITTLDYGCLAEETYINDTIIDFYLAFLNKMVISPGDRARTHIFSSYFYSRLTKRIDLRECSKDSPAEKRHKRVRSWTKKTDLFEKDFIIIPINENSHWFLAIICFPSLTGPVGFTDHNPMPEDETAAKPPPPPAKKSKPPPCPLTIDVADNNSDRDEAEAEDDLSEYDSDSDESNVPVNGTPSSQTEKESIKDPPEVTTKIKRLPQTKEPIKQPCILIFDSLKGSNSRARVVATLRDFLKVEYKWKTGEDRSFTKDNFKGAVLKVPQQDNYFDCGLFVLQYVESFFKSPLHDYRLPIRYLSNWFSEKEMRNKRKEVAEVIKCLMLENGDDHRSMMLPDLSAPASMMMDDEDEEEEEEEEELEDEEYEGEEMEEEGAHVGEVEGEEDIEEDQNIYMDMEVTGDEEESDSASQTPGGSWIQNNIISVKQYLENRPPSDGTTTQSLRSIRVNRLNQRAIEQPPTKRLKD